MDFLPSCQIKQCSSDFVDVGCSWLHVSVVLTLCGAEVGLVDGTGIIVDWAYTHAPLIALDFRQPVRELHLLGVFHLHSVP